MTRSVKGELGERGPGDAAGDVDGYEQLRGRVLAGDASGWRMGLAVVQHRGVAAWLRVRSSVSPAPPAPADSGLTPVAATVGDQLVAVLAGMALGAAARG